MGHDLPQILRISVEGPRLEVGGALHLGEEAAHGGRLARFLAARRELLEGGGPVEPFQVLRDLPGLLGGSGLVGGPQVEGAPFAGVIQLHVILGDLELRTIADVALPV